MRIVTWNLNNLKGNTAASDKLFGFNPDIALLSEVNHIPDDLRGYVSHFEYAMGHKGLFRKLKTCLICKGKIGEPIPLVAKEAWVKKAFIDFPGNFVTRKVKIKNGPQFNVVSVHMPSWQFPHEDYTKDPF